MSSLREAAVPARVADQGAGRAGIATVVAEIAETYDMAEDRIRIVISYHEHQVALNH